MILTVYEYLFNGEQKSNMSFLCNKKKKDFEECENQP